MRILITNNTLAARAGSELYVRDIALAFQKRGHQPLTYSPHLGEVADELRAAHIPVYDDLNQLEPAPDIIHGQHHLETMTALQRFPLTPAISYCHGYKPWEEAPLKHPHIMRYVAVDQPCHERLVEEGGIDPARITTLYNFVDLERFQPRPPLPAKPARALVFSHYASENTQLRAIREACAQVGIRLDVMGMDAGKSCAAPEKELGQYDVVFAKARAALEAMAVGNAVILCDFSGAGPLVTTENMARLRPLNFGFRTLTEPLTAEFLCKEINRYNAEDAQHVSNMMRAQVGIDAVVERLLELYQEAIEELTRNPQHTIAPSANATASYLRWLSTRFYESYSNASIIHLQNIELSQLRAELESERLLRAAEKSAAHEQALAQALAAALVQPVLPELTLNYLLKAFLRKKTPRLFQLLRQLKKPS